MTKAAAEKPTLVLSRQIIEDQETWRDRPFSCSGQLGYPHGSLEIQSNIYGNFTTILSITNDSNNFVATVGDWSTTGPVCESVQSVDFGLKSSAVTKRLHNTKLRCVIVPSSDVEGQAPVYSEEIIKVVDSM